MNNAEVYGYVDAQMAKVGFKPHPQPSREEKFSHIVDLARRISSGEEIFVSELGHVGVKKCQDHLYDCEQKDIEIALDAHSYLFKAEEELLKSCNPNELIAAYEQASADFFCSANSLMEFMNAHGAITKVAIIHFVRHWRKELVEAMRDAA